VRLIHFFFALLSVCAYGQNTYPPIGAWREHLPYQSAVAVTASDKKVYCATLYSLFSVDLASDEVQRISKVAGLSETGISTIQYDGLTQRLYIAYNNSNIDILDQKGITNIPDLKRENTSGDKSIYQIYPDNEKCYLSTGLGILVLDAVKGEISESWLIGSNGTPIRCNACIKTAKFFYAATEEGLKKIPVLNSDPADFHQWQMVSGNGGLSTGACKGIAYVQNKVVALQNDSLFVENNNAWSLFFANGWPITSFSVSGNKLLVCQRQSNGDAQVIVLNSDATLVSTIQHPGLISMPEHAIMIHDDYWVADLNGGLTHWQGSNVEQYKPNSPGNIALGGMAIYNNVLYATAGSVNSSWNYQYNPSGIFRLENGSWTNFNLYSYPQLDTLLDFLTVAVDPRDGSVWGGSFGGGLLHIKSDQDLQVFKQNSPIGATIGDPLSYRVSGLAFDADNNLWIANFGSARQLHVWKKDSTWQSFSAPFNLSVNAVSQILIDDANQKWIVSPLNNGLLVFNHGKDLENTADDQWKLYKAGAGTGNLPSNEVYCIARDKSGFIWVGTSNGIGVIQCPEAAFQGGCETIWPVTKEGALTNYLFNGQEVCSIAVDGADRKWIAAPSGAWLISKDGDKVLAHFTEDNSPLLSNDVRSIAINGQTGEVFFATAKGICSFRGMATEASETPSKVLVFPNPVPPHFQGPIAIRGLPENSIVKITETNGRLVYQSRSLGGQAIWDGKDYRGNSASNGVYLVLAVDENKQEKVVAKVVFIGAK
jgi:ligand-binding sensor domain-containing protein